MKCLQWRYYPGSKVQMRKQYTLNMLRARHAVQQLAKGDETYICAEDNEIMRKLAAKKATPTAQPRPRRGPARASSRQQAQRSNKRAFWTRNINFSSYRTVIINQSVYSTGTKIHPSARKSKCLGCDIPCGRMYFSTKEVSDTHKNDTNRKPT